MATINTTQVLGTDTLGSFRIITNQNFTTVTNAINTLETFLNTSPANGDLNIGNILIKKGLNPDTTILFKNEASGQIDGNFTINKDLTVNKFLNVNDVATFNNGITINGGTNKLLNIGNSTTEIHIKHQKGMFIDLQFDTTTATIADVETSGVVFDLDITNKRVVYLDYSGYTGSSGHNANELNLTGTPTPGQRIYIRIVSLPTTLPSVNFKIRTDATTSFSPEYNTTATLEFPVSAGSNAIKKMWIELIYTTGGFKVINAHPLIINI